QTDFRIEPVTCDPSVFNSSAYLFDIDRTNIAQGPARFPDCGLRGVFPTLRRFREQFDDFNNFCHGVISSVASLEDRTREADRFYFAELSFNRCRAATTRTRSESTRVAVGLLLATTLR